MLVINNKLDPITEFVTFSLKFLKFSFKRSFMLDFYDGTYLILIIISCLK